MQSRFIFFQRFKFAALRAFVFFFFGNNGAGICSHLHQEKWTKFSGVCTGYSEALELFLLCTLWRLLIPLLLCCPILRLTDSSGQSGYLLSDTFWSDSYSTGIAGGFEWASLKIFQVTNSLSVPCDLGIPLWKQQYLGTFYLILMCWWRNFYCCCCNFVCQKNRGRDTGEHRSSQRCHLIWQSRSLSYHFLLIHLTPSSLSSFTAGSG